MPNTEQIGLTSRQVQTFIDDGFVKIEMPSAPNLQSNAGTSCGRISASRPTSPKTGLNPLFG